MKSIGYFTIPINDSIINFKLYNKKNNSNSSRNSNEEVLYLVVLVDPIYHRKYVVVFDEKNLGFLK
jgi:hypothetical protein